MRSERVTEINGRAETAGSLVLYWMQASVRAERNFALDWAIGRANELGLPLLVLFCLVRNFPRANPAHYRYLLEGLDDARRGMEAKGARFAVAEGRSEELVPRFARHSSLVVSDTGYLPRQRLALASIAADVPCRLVHVEGNTVVPPRLASPKEEWSAATLRRKIRPLLDVFLEESAEPCVRRSGAGMYLPEHVPVPPPYRAFPPPGEAPRRFAEQRIADRGGGTEAASRFGLFLDQGLDRYADGSDDPLALVTSRMSAALHFGHASPVDLVRRVLERTGERSASECRHEGAAAYIEQLVVRRELAVNFVLHRDDCEDYSCVSEWARKSLAEGELHPRARLYSEEELEDAATDDPYWNAAQDLLVRTGEMHGRMRMYWGKRLIAWTGTVREAWRMATELNDRYALDGRDPNSRSGIAWCFGKHDRPWKGRPIYGTVRYMNAGGLKRKFDADAYVRLSRRLIENGGNE